MKQIPQIFGKQRICRCKMLIAYIRTSVIQQWLKFWNPWIKIPNYALDMLSMFHIESSFLHVGLQLIKYDPSITDYRGEMTFMNDTDICATLLLVCRKGTIQSGGNFNPSHYPMDQYSENFCVQLLKIKSLSCYKTPKFVV